MNHPFVSFMTNIGKYTIFNNMTYHFNFTLPTQLDESGNLKNRIEEFSDINYTDEFTRRKFFGNKKGNLSDPFSVNLQGNFETNTQLGLRNQL